MASVKDAGLLRRSEVFYISVFASLVVALGGAITGFILLGDSWFQLLIAAALGIIFTQFAFLGHEASHRQVFSSNKANDWAGRALTSGFVGMSYSWWMNKHTRHHGNPNMIGRDPDIEPDTFSFLEKDAAQTRGLMGLFTKHQSKFFFPLLAFEGINLHVKSIAHVFGRGKVDERGWEITMIVGRIVLVVAAVFLVLPLGMAFAFLGVQLAVFGIYLGAAFAPNHIGMTIVPEGAKLDFLRKQVLTSRNVKGGWWMTALMGGLNFQVEHHLFPSMARPHLRRAREMVLAVCEREQIPYTETSLPRAWGIVLESLERVGLSAGAAFRCPVVDSYGRV
jgi:fatty acid desaturase